MDELLRGLTINGLLLATVAVLALLLVLLRLRRWVWLRGARRRAVRDEEATGTGVVAATGRVTQTVPPSPESLSPVAATAIPAATSPTIPQRPVPALFRFDYPEPSTDVRPALPSAAVSPPALTVVPRPAGVQRDSPVTAATPVSVQPAPLVPIMPTAPVPPAVASHPAPPVLTVVPKSNRPRPKVVREVDDQVLSPETLLERAHLHLAAGASEEATAQLRLCVRLASKLKQPAIEAAARLELGDLARASGDLTTACEHWQMARALYAALRRDIDTRAAELRMERARCPSDWVLNQF
jgi:hypothetical protein